MWGIKRLLTSLAAILSIITLSTPSPAMAGVFFPAAGSASCGSAASIDDTWDSGGTATIWFKVDAIGTNPRLLDKATANTPTNGWELNVGIDGVSNTDVVAFRDDWSGTDGQWWTSTTTGPLASKNMLGRWVFFAITYTTGAGPTFYAADINGEVVSQPRGFTTNPGGGQNSDAGATLRIGGSATADRQFQGTIGPIHLYKRILQPFELNMLAHNMEPSVTNLVMRLNMGGSANNFLPDSSGKGNFCTISGGPVKGPNTQYIKYSSR